LWVISTYFSPHRRGFYLRIARRQQQLRLVRLQYPRRFGARRPPLEPSFGQSLRRQPEPLAIVLQDSDGRSTIAGWLQSYAEDVLYRFFIVDK
jgi:hypothetical protein